MTPEEAFARKYGSRSRARFIRHEPCANCGAKGCSLNAHCPPPGESGGMGYKPSWKWVVPLCDECHRLRDVVIGGNAGFLSEGGVDLTSLARWYAEHHPPERYPDDQLAY